MKNTGTQNNRLKQNGKHEAQTLDFDYLGASQELLFEKFRTSQKGLNEEEAKIRLEKFGYNEPLKKKKRSVGFSRIIEKLRALNSWFSGTRDSRRWPGPPNPV